VSNDVTNAMRKWQGPPPQKSVLMSLCDGASDDGLVPDWRSSVGALREWTCLGRTAVIEALKGLQAAGVISIDRSFGRVNKIRVVVEHGESAPNQSATQTGTSGGPVRETDHHQSATRTTPVRETDGTSPADGPLTPLHQTPEKHLFDETSHVPTKKRKAVAQQQTSLPDEFDVNETGRRFAEERGIDLHRELQGFKDYHAAKGTRFADWQAAWRTWCNNAVKFSGGRSSQSQAPRARSVTSHSGFAHLNYREGVAEDGSIL
jgi:hypothetical protein